MTRNIRAAVPADAESIFELVNELADYERLSHMVTGTSEDLAKSIEAGHCWAYVCEVADEVVGYALGFRTYSTFLMKQGTWLEDLYVRQKDRGQGHGKALLTYIRDEAVARGDGRLEWSVLDWNESSIEFYCRMGADLLPDWRICRMTL